MVESFAFTFITLYSILTHICCLDYRRDDNTNYLTSTSLPSKEIAILVSYNRTLVWITYYKNANGYKSALGRCLIPTGWKASKVRIASL